MKALKKNVAYSCMWFFFFLIKKLLVPFKDELRNYYKICLLCALQEVSNSLGKENHSAPVSQTAQL